MKIQNWCLLVLTTIAASPLALAEGKSRLQIAREKAREAVEKRDRLEAEYKAAAKEAEALALAASLEAGEEQPDQPVISESAIRRISQELTEKRNLKFEVRQSVRDKTKKGLPATFQLTRTKNGKDSKVADMGISVDYGIKDSDFAIGLLAEYHHSTKSEKDKKGTDSLIAGPRIQWNGLSFMDTTQRITGSLLYKHDETVSGEGWGGDVSIYPEIPEWYIGKDVGVIPGYLSATLEPILGIQYEKGDGSKGFRDGKRVSAKAGINLAMTLFPHYFGNRLTLDNKLTYWEHFDTEGVYDRYNEEQWYATSTLTYWFDTRSSMNNGPLLPDEQHIGLSAGLKWGDNPDEGQLDTDTMTLGISVKY